MHPCTSFFGFSRSFLALWTVLVLFGSGFGARLSLAQISGEQRVIIVSVDGLRSDIIQNLGRSNLPSFFKIIDEGAVTNNARIDPDYAITLPNHSSILTGRFVDGPQGHQWRSNTDPAPGETVHNVAGTYVPSVFDGVHDAGGRTGLFSTKTKFSLFDQSWDATSGAADVTGQDNGKDKIDEYVYSTSSAAAVQSFIMASAQPFDLTFLHFFEPDDVGHISTWDPHPGSVYAEAVQRVDRALGSLLDFVDQNPAYAGKTSIILTADHGGSGNNHTEASSSINFTIPFMVWGYGVESGADLYAINQGHRQDPDVDHVSRTEALTPIRNADAPNLALHLLGLPALSGSTINAAQDLKTGDASLLAGFKSIAFQDGVAPSPSYAGTTDTKIKSDAPETSFGSDPDLEMDANPDYSTLIKWDLSAFPAGAQVLSATMVFDITNISNLDYEYYAISREWDENTATWAFATGTESWGVPGASGLTDHAPASLGTITADVPAFYRFNLSEATLPLIQEWIDDPSSNYGLIFQDYTSGDDGLDISSSEFPEAARRPRLEITYTDIPPAISPALPVAEMSVTLRREGATIHMDADASASFDPDGSIASYEWRIGAPNSLETTSIGATLSLDLNELGTYEVALLVRDDAGNEAVAYRPVIVDEHDRNLANFQDGQAPISRYHGTRDTKIASSSPSNSYGDDPWLVTDGSPLGATLLSWDLSAIAPGVDVTKATIALEVLDESIDTYEMYGVSRAWNEQEANWLTASSGEFWELEGADGSSDRNELSVGEVNGAAIGALEVPLNAEGLALVSQWINNPASNHGLVLQDYLAASDGLDVASKDFGTREMRPRLSLEYQTRHHVNLPELIEFATYPNPFANQLTINLASDIPHDVRFELIDMLGRRVLVQPLSSGLLAGPIRLDTSDLAAGMYALRVIEHNDIVSKTILVAKAER